MNLMDRLFGGRTDLENIGSSVARDVTSTSPEARQRGWDSLENSGARALGRAALSGVTGYAAGAPMESIGKAMIGSAVNPASVLGIAGDFANSTLGIGANPTIGAKIAGFLAPTVGGLLGGPIGSIGGGLLGKVAIDAFGDLTNTRKEENIRDDYEDNYGYKDGRTAYADRFSMNELARDLQNSSQNPMTAVHAFDDFISKLQAMEDFYGAKHGLATGRDYSSVPTYGSTIGGPAGGFRAIDQGYGPNMGGFGGLGIGNPSSYGGGNNGIGSGLGGSRGIGGVSGADLGKGSESW